MSEPIIIQKAPGVQREYEFGWVDAASDPIVTSNWTVPAGITKVTDSIKGDGTATLLTLSSGTDGTNYTLVNDITYTSGQTDSRTVTVEVRARASVVPLLVSTAGSATANSYSSLLQADTYFAGRLNSSDWFDANSSDKEAALITATSILDQFDYVGIPITVLDTNIEDGYSESVTPQALKWPRVMNTDGDLIRNYIVTVIPPPIRWAQCETALWLLQTNVGAVAAGTVSELQIGSSVKVKYSAGSLDTSVDNAGLPIQAARMLKGLRLVNVLA